jgi:hypothetical protein
MVTVVDPNGTPAPVYTRSGTTIQSIVAAGNNSFVDATPIVAVSGWSIVMAQATDTPAFETGVILPSDTQIGDVVELYAGGYTVIVFPPTGQTINGISSQQVGPGAAVIFRKLSATEWRTLR